MTAPTSPLPPGVTSRGGAGGGHGGGARQATFTCLSSAYSIRHACLRRNWNALKTEMDWAAKNGATVEVESDGKSVFVKVVRGNADGFDLITDLHPREASQITESLRECGATIKETT